MCRQLDYYAKRYETLDEQKLEHFLDGTHAPAKPLLILSFDDGLLDNYQVAAPLLEARGLPGWFFIPAGLPDVPQSDQIRYCREHSILIPKDMGPRLAMNWSEIADLSKRGHVIGCHTWSHRRMKGGIDDRTIEHELYNAKQQLEAHVQKPVTSFAWVGGEPDTYNAKVMHALAKAGFAYSFTTQSALYRKTDPVAQKPLIIHRTVLDADMNYLMFRAKLGGLSDMMHLARRWKSIKNMGLQ